jgi:hypothetical protein
MEIGREAFKAKGSLWCEDYGPMKQAINKMEA